jgi:hypothetical protein
MPEAVVDANELDVVGRRRDVSGHASCQSIDNLLTDWTRQSCKCGHRRVIGRARRLTQSRGAAT